MDSGELAASVAYCGLVCGLCDHSAICNGCRAEVCTTDGCDKAHCAIRQCCLEHDIAGCWQCAEFPCEKGRYADANRGQTVGFVTCIQDKGLDDFVTVLLTNEQRGIRYGMDGPYYHAEADTVSALLDMARRE